MEGQVESGFSIGNAINGFLHRIMDVEECAYQYIPLAEEARNEKGKILESKLQDYAENREEGGINFKEVRDFVRDIERHTHSNPTKVLSQSLFISLFSSFDKFIGDLIVALYARNPHLYQNIKREISLSDVLDYPSIEAIREAVLDKEIETIRRKSYLEQFADLGNKFSIDLTGFDRWPSFVEASQRRNLFTHCDGVVSKQYLEICSKVNFKFAEKPKVGDKLDLETNYFFDICHLLSDVGVMLGQTLWRKIEPKNIQLADSNLNDLIFDYLHIESWDKSISLSKFALNLPRFSDNKMYRILTVNYAIALKAKGNSSAAKKLLDQQDWSAVSYDFRLAYSVLCGDFSESSEIMKKIGINGELVNKSAYDDWPLFRDFRESTEFNEAYESIYGHKYYTNLNVHRESFQLEETGSDFP